MHHRQEIYILEAGQQRIFLVISNNSNTILFKDKYLMGLAGLWTAFQALSTRPR